MFSMKTERGNLLKKHIKGDGNGGFFVSKPFAIISILITLLLACIPMVYSYGGLNFRVDNIETQIEKIDDLEKRTDEYDTDIAVIKEKIIHIESNIKEIKEILREKK